ncbi:hypothetical protein VNO80_16013 [Phaseolus coccineus]|uniref:Uncharacterized protein n=1 Tax=Phaseolus coccineus TaxID=3886 RepID=A0AAN9MSG8_PHACN
MSIPGDARMSHALAMPACLASWRCPHVSRPGDVLRSPEVATASDCCAPYDQPRIRPSCSHHQHRSTLRARAADVAAPSAPAPPKSLASLLPCLILTSFGLFWFMLLAKKVGS